MMPTLNEHNIIINIYSLPKGIVPDDIKIMYQTKAKDFIASINMKDELM